MDAIDLMMDEHKYILRGLKLFKILSVEILNSNTVDFVSFEKMILFVRNYGDKHHHNKEEVVLFKKMETQLGQNMVKGPLSGMYIEHDLGRQHITLLEEALLRVKNGDLDSRVDIIANSVCYADLLTRHIDKEDKLIYTFARRALSQVDMEGVNVSCENIELEATKNQLQKEYISVLEELEKKYLD
ncbi:hemerythrin domain-containing protein [Clostridium sp. CM028]|uniref:hemerythrin domain-containing protein n=1 Tax=unclassified Clostridium TaxID=2614128 RepID=UPI001C6DD664|nr:MULTISPECIES: hemerythrin domain-containing protein [unclassified Clostridium]MBW9145781.1 hemerythrin domain-containing protein [Clostridium sp. CM027]MBW9149817.1 hemerythrin domain-containing protein [Clostridium sp. CM028]UVE42154.1 hemerythrin domain-containing protein [Clostridium sp. CM027]WLC62762.1 hemerythrin domain-containing protein [Clostridium sp. CM028]